MSKIIDDKVFHFKEYAGCNQTTGEHEYWEYDVIIPLRKDGGKLHGFVGDGCNPQYI